ncbi:MAG TPA: hypothetical protein VLH60_08055 [Sedimentisphaerales bacterium]|nr:hypothetical protein [Sedimentisphaerales bacterium]
MSDQGREAIAPNRQESKKDDGVEAKHWVPLAFNVMQRFLAAGFVLKEDIVKVQHNCMFTRRWEWKAKRDKFYLIMHEHLFVFRKAAKRGIGEFGRARRDTA